jgi:hypothetical protein
MAGIEMKNAVLIAVIVVVALFIVYQYDPTLFGLLGRRREGFADAKANGKAPATGLGAKMNGMQKNGTGAMGSAQHSAGQTATQPNVAKAATQPTAGAAPAGQALKEQPKEPQGTTMATKPGTAAEGFADLVSMEGPANFASVSAPAGCYPRDQLTPTELLPADQNTIYAQQNPMGPGSLKGKNFLSAGALIGVNTVGQSMRNANLQIRSEPPNPQVPVSIFNQSTIQPDVSHRPLEVGN